MKPTPENEAFVVTRVAAEIDRRQPGLYPPSIVAALAERAAKEAIHKRSPVETAIKFLVSHGAL